MTKFSITSAINVSIYYAVDTAVWTCLIKGIRAHMNFSLYDLIEDGIYDKVDNSLLHMIGPELDLLMNQETI